MLTRSHLRERHSGRDDAAVNELIGTILLMAIAVGLVGVFILVLFSVPGPQPASHTEVQAFIAPTAQNQLVLEHRGGPAIPIAQLVASVSVNGTATSYVVGDNIGGTWQVTGADGTVKAATDRFSLGDQARFTSPTLYKASASVTLIDRNAEALTLGSTAVRDADTTAPTFQGSRTATTTTVTVNFTEPLRSILAADFTVGGSTPSSVVLLGNGSSAEFTVGVAFATDATPAVASIATPTGTFDLAGNAFAGGATSTPTDGVAPAITVGPAATPTSSAATVTWTTPESGSSLVRYGPTPSDLGISGTGADGTSHSVSLVGLTDNFRYYYAVTTVDAAGATITSATGSFVTSAVAGGGGGGSGDPVPLHFVINQTFSPLTSGTPSAIGTPFRLALRNATAAVTTATTAITVTLTTNSSVGYFLDNAGALLDVQNFQIGIGESWKEFRYVDFRDGGYSVIGVTSANVTPAFTTVQVSGNTGKGTPFRLEFSTQDTSQASGTATGNLAISVRDVYDNLVQAPYAIQVNLSTNSTSAYFQSGSTPISSITISAGSATTSSFTYVDHRPAGTSSLLFASAQGMTPATMQMASAAGTTSVLAVGNRLEFTAVPTGSLTSGTATTVDYIVAMKDAAGRSITPDGNVIVRLSTNSSSAYFLDPDGTTPITSRTLTTSNGTAWFKYIDFRSNGISHLVASSNGTIPASAIAPVTGGTPPWDHLSWTTAPTSMAAGSIAGPYVLTLRDHMGQARVTPSAVQLTLETNSTYGVYCADSSCATLITRINVTAGGSTTPNLYYRDARFSSMAVLTARADRTTGASVVVSVTGGSNFTGGSGTGAPVPHHLGFTTTNATLNPGINSTTWTVELRDANNSAFTAIIPVVVQLSTSSPEGVFLSDSTLAKITSVTIGIGSSSANFRFRDNSSLGGTFQVAASADNVIPALQPITVYDRGYYAEQGDSEASVRVFLAQHVEETDTIVHNIGISILNPTPTAKVVTSVTFRASPATNGSWFATAPSTSTAASGWFSACTWTRSETNHNATCDMSDFSIPPYSIAQAVISYTTMSIASDDSTVVTATAYLLNMSRDDSVNVRHENTAGSGSDVELMFTDTASGASGNKMAGLANLTAGSVNNINIRVEHLQDTTNVLVRIAIPSGWAVDVANVPLMDHYTIGFQRGVQGREGLLTIGIGSGAAGTSDATLPIQVTPPGGWNGVAVWRGEVITQGVGQPLTSQLNGYAVSVI